MVGHGSQRGLPVGEVVDRGAGEGLDSVPDQAGDALLGLGELWRALLEPGVEPHREQGLAGLVAEHEVDEQREGGAEVLGIGGLELDGDAWAVAARVGAA